MRIAPTIRDGPERFHGDGRRTKAMRRILAGAGAEHRPCRAVGDGFRVVGFGDIGECAGTHPPLSSLRCDIAAFGRRMAGTLLSWLEERVRPPPATLSLVEPVIPESPLP